MNKWRELLRTIFIVLLAIMALWGLWIDYEKTKLNQRYKAQVELYEKETKSFIDFLDQTKGLIRGRLDQLGLQSP